MTLIKLIIFGVVVVFLAQFFLQPGRSFRSLDLHSKKHTVVWTARMDEMKQAMFRLLDVAEVDLASPHVREIPRCRGTRQCARTTAK
jgi:hypothetical protein